MSYIVVVTTTKNKKEAMNVIRKLLKARLIACANIVGPVTSLFWWKEKIDETNEFLLLMKSHQNHFEKITEVVMEIHSYEIPEILAFPVAECSSPYMDWLERNLQPVNENG